MKTSLGSKIFDTCNYIFLGLLAIITIFPFWILVMSSFVGVQEYYSKTFVLWPSDPNIISYRFLFSSDWIYRGYQNSIIVTVCGTLYGMALVSLTAYAMTYEGLPGKVFINWYFIFTMYFSGGLIPYYLLVANYLKWTDNLIALWLPGGLGVWGFLVLRNFFKGLPNELRESATLDGANELTILTKIILPLSLPALATLTLFSAVGAWNSWTGAFYFINTQKKYPLPLILRRMVVQDTNGSVEGDPAYIEMERAYQKLVGGDRSDINTFDVAVRNATIVITALPVMLLYPFFQKYFAQGVLVGSVKG